VGSATERELVRRFADAFTADDVDAVVALLTDDGWLAMPPAPHEYHGPAAVAAFLRASAGWRAGRRLRLRPTRANRQPAFSCRLDGQPAGMVVLTLTGDLIRGITRFLPVTPRPFDPGR
jgi:RNA polymerase sigma-70 factor (ECF subfamily)